MKDNKSNQNPHHNQLLSSAPTSNKAIINPHETDLNILSDHEAPLNKNTPPFFISHTRAQAIEAGFLIEVTKAAAKLGFTLPVALTRAVWESCIAKTATGTKKITQSEEDRLEELLHAGLLACTHSSVAPRYYFALYRPCQNEEGYLVQIDLVMYISPGYASPPAITIMLPNED